MFKSKILPNSVECLFQEQFETYQGEQEGSSL